MPRIGRTESVSAPGCSREQHLSATQSRPAPDRPEENGKAPQLALSCYEPNRCQCLRSSRADRDAADRRRDATSRPVAAMNPPQLNLYEEDCAHSGPAVTSG